MDRKVAMEWMQEHSSNSQLEKKLNIYYKFLVEKNQMMNLTAIIEEEQVYVKHFYDSALLLDTISLKGMKVIDVGSGAGFPGIVLKLMNSDFELTIVEALEKRCIFLQELVSLLELENVNIVHERCEIYARNHQEVYDLGMCRAVGGLSLMMELMVRLIKIEGELVFYKGPKWNEEIEHTHKTQRLLSLDLKCVKHYSQEKLGERYLGFFVKKKQTADKYPRNYSQIKKTPLN